MIKCPTCKGIGRIFSLFGEISFQCQVCNGLGLIDDKKQLWIKQGVYLKQYRLKRLKLGLREACRKYNLDPSYVSKMERGIIAPTNPYLKGGEMKLSIKQIKLMEHTISDPNRNWFATGYNCDDSNEFEKIVDAGYATKHPAPSWTGDDVIYCLTKEGKEKIQPR